MHAPSASRALTIALGITVRLAATLPPGLIPGVASAQESGGAQRAVRSGLVVGADLLVVGGLRSAATTGDAWRAGPGAAFRAGYVDAPGYGILVEGALSRVGIRGLAHDLFETDFLLRAPLGHRRTRAGLVEGVLDLGGGLVELARAPEAVTAGPRIVRSEGAVFTGGLAVRLHLPRCLAAQLGAHGASGRFTDRRVGMSTTHGLRDGVRTFRVTLGIDWMPPRDCAAGAQ